MKTVEIVLFDNANGLDITGPLEVFSVATKLFRRKEVSNKGYTVTFSGNKTGLTTLSSGLKIQAEMVTGAGSATDNFIIPGGLGVDKVCETPLFIHQIKQKATTSKRTVSICTGAFILAKSGLLQGKSCTTHWSRAAELAKQYPDLNVKPDAIFIKDGNTYTSAGVTAGIDLALALVEQDYGSRIAIEIARILVLYMRRTGGQSQFSAPIELRSKAGEEFSRLHDWILENIESPLLIEDLAEYFAMSPRNFSRNFTEKTGITPGKYVELMRLGKARELLESGKQAIDIIARKCGFQREERMRRAFIRTLGVTPSQYRTHFNKNS